ncbi:MAG: glycosyl hydrolase [Bacteroidia bacterium]|nr:glycosyl hydrolase [Bacteroidia bacterium]
MKIRLLFKGALIVVFVISSFNCTLAIEPVNPNATPEAKALLDLFYRISGKYTLTGQHNYPNTKDQNTRFAAKYIGKTPVIWSSDMGFAKDGDSDSYLARPDIVKEAIRQHHKGSIITICWHAVPPTADEPVTFQARGPVTPGALASVQGKLPDEQFKDVLTPGTKLYMKWAAQVDSVAVYLKKLQAANVPVLWRPYHEMNGDWFWWGGRVGENGTIDLYRQIYDRLVNYHKLNNLIWVWNIDRPSTPIRKFSNFYPGNDYLDIASLDVYGSDFNQAYYDSLIVLAKGKPILFGEVGNPPILDVYEHQPKWTSWVIWAGMVRNTSKKQYQELVNNPRMLSLEDPTYWEVSAPYRKACGLSKLPLKSKCPVSFTGNWIFNEGKSDIGKNGTGNVPSEMEIDQDDDLLYVKKQLVMEWGDDRITNEVISLDGSEMKSEFFNAPRISKASLDIDSKTLNINSVVKFNRGGQTTEMKSSEVWSLQQDGKVLRILQTSTGFRGEKIEVSLVFEKQ